MNENQKNFLNDLAELFRKYSIDDVDPSHDEVTFWSNGSRLSFEFYHDGRFERVKHHYEQNHYAPETN